MGTKSTEPRRSRRSRDARGRAITGLLFVAPALLILGVFLFLPILTAGWVSVSDWNGKGSPFQPSVNFVGTENYSSFLTEGGLSQKDFGTSIRNNLYYVLVSVPLVTAIALGLALMVNKSRRGSGVFRTAFYFPSVTSSVALTVIFLFLFNSTGVVNEILGLISIDGPTWMADPRGIFHLALEAIGIPQPAPRSGFEFWGVSWWDWLSGPSVAMSVFILMAALAASGTFMLIFLAGLQQISDEVEEAAIIDGATRWQRFWYVTLPLLRPTLFTVLTLCLIGSWQVFDQIYTGSQGNPAKTTLTPAYLSYEWSFKSSHWGQGAAVSFILFGIIVIFTLLQRWGLRERSSDRPRRLRAVRTQRSAKSEDH
jgi:multiple sugar transport system permease protein